MIVLDEDAASGTRRRGSDRSMQQTGRLQDSPCLVMWRRVEFSDFMSRVTLGEVVVSFLTKQ